jgi:hypothetical protein
MKLSQIVYLLGLEEWEIPIANIEATEPSDNAGSFLSHQAGSHIVQRGSIVFIDRRANLDYYAGRLGQPSTSQRRSLEMDSSNRPNNLDVIFGNMRVPLWQITHQEMVVALFDKVLQEAKPMLKYLPRFEPIASHLNCWIGGEAHRITANAPEFPQGISEKTKVVEVETMEEAKTDTMVVRKVLLLTDEASLLLWEATYSRKLVPRGHGDMDEDTKESRFKLLTGETINGFSSQSHLWKKDWKAVMLGIVRRLKDLTRAGVEKREERLASMRRLDDFLERTLSHIRD